jgi:hypothetical protein
MAYTVAVKLSRHKVTAVSELCSQNKEGHDEDSRQRDDNNEEQCVHAFFTAERTAESNCGLMLLRGEPIELRHGHTAKLGKQLRVHNNGELNVHNL